MSSKSRGTKHSADTASILTAEDRPRPGTSTLKAPRNTERVPLIGRKHNGNFSKATEENLGNFCIAVT
jgi:hypothetical protein